MHSSEHIRQDIFAHRGSMHVRKNGHSRLRRHGPRWAAPHKASCAHQACGAGCRCAALMRQADVLTDPASRRQLMVVKLASGKLASGVPLARRPQDAARGRAGGPSDPRGGPQLGSTGRASTRIDQLGSSQALARAEGRRGRGIREGTRRRRGVSAGPDYPLRCVRVASTRTTRTSAAGRLSPGRVGSREAARPGIRGAASGPVHHSLSQSLTNSVAN